MSEHTDKAKRTRLVAVIAAAAVLVIALGILVGGKLSGILFNGQDLFKTTRPPRGGSHCDTGHSAGRYLFPKSFSQPDGGSL